MEPRKSQFPICILYVISASSDVIDAKSILRVINASEYQTCEINSCPLYCVHDSEDIGNDMVSVQQSPSLVAFPLKRQFQNGSDQGDNIASITECHRVETGSVFASSYLE